MVHTTRVRGGFGVLLSAVVVRSHLRPPSFARFAKSVIVLVAAALTMSSGASAEQGATIQSLDAQVQTIKGDVLAIAAELANLEEQLLYPSETHVAVFVALDETTSDGFELDSMKISIDGKSVAEHIYSFKEVEALEKGGVQRIHTGNLRTGKHRIEVHVAGRLANGEDFEQSGMLEFRKDVEPKRLGITLAGGGPGGGAKIAVGDW
jgi:hypothetical protein